MIGRSDEATPLVFGGACLGVMCFGLLFEICSRTSLLEWIYNHEALAAGILGILAASVTALLILWQIRQQYRIANDSRERRLEAVKSVIPLTISELSAIFHESFRTSLRMCKGENFKPVLPELDDLHIDALKTCVEHGDIRQQKFLLKLLRQLQIQRSRLRDAIEKYEPLTEDELIEIRRRGNEYADLRTFASGGYLYSSALVSLMVDELWDYVGPKESRDPMGSRASRIAKLFIFHSDEQPEDWPKFIEHFMNTADI